MIIRDDRDILRATLLVQAPQTTNQIAARGWGPHGTWGKLKDFEAAGVTRKVGNPRPPFNAGAIEWELTPQGCTLLLQPEPVASATHFLRFGDWCACECSCNSATKILEVGVSVYECYPDGAHWRYIDSRAISKNERTLVWNPWILVTGTVQPTRGLGDGEPLLKNVTLVSALQWDPVHKRFAVLAAGAGARPRQPHPGHGAPGGCVCT